jgi:hypothetical protein
MSDERSNQQEGVYHSPELINGQWYYFVEPPDPFAGVTTHGPFPSRDAAQAHRDETMRRRE